MISSDSFGNKYWNKFAKALILQNYIYNNDEINSDWTSIKQFFEDFFGDRFTGGATPADPSGFTLTSVFEEKTTSTSTDYTGNRFIIKGTGESNGVGISSDSALVSPSISVAANNIFNDTSSTKATIISVREDCVVGFIFENIPPAPLVCKGMIAFGWLVNGVYPDDNLTGYGNAFFIIGDDTNIEAFHLSEKNSNVKKAILTSGLANFTFESNDAGVTIPADAVTNLVLIDADSSQMIGSVPSNLLVGKGNISLGALYKLNSFVGQGDTNATPNLETRVFLAARGWDSRKLLLRVPSSGLINDDPYYDNVVLYLKGDGDNNSTTIVDASPNPKTITRFGDTKISTTQSKYGGSSIYFDGSDYLMLQSYVDSYNDFTIEYWAYILVSNWSGIFVSNASTNYTDGAVNNLGSFRLQVGGDNIHTTISVPVNTWFHYAVSRSGNSVKCFVNGVESHSLTNSTPVLFNNNLRIGSYNGSLYNMNGYLDSLRITKGIARYTTNFNPETDTYMAETYLAINDISDNVLTPDEKSSPLTISGVSYGLNDLTVTVSLNGVNYTSTVIGNAWSVTVPSADLQNLTASDYTVTAVVTKDAQVFLAQKLLYVSVSNDPYFSNVVLYLKGDGDNNSTNIIDSSTNPKTITRFGDAKISTTQSKYGASSIYFDGVGDYLRVASLIPTGGITFTVEAWVFPTATFSHGFFDTGSGQVGVLRYYINNLERQNGAKIPITLPLNTWSHLALTYDKTTGTANAFVNGVLIGTANFGTTFVSTNFDIGTVNSGGYNFSGYFDSYRVSNIVRYTTNFNPETDTYMAETYLAINDISDNVLTPDEKSSPLTISGVSYGLNDLTVTVTLNSLNYTSTVVDNAWSVTVPPVDLQNLTLTSYTVTASVTKDAQVISAQKLLYVPNDPYFSNVVLYLKGDGANNSTTIVDSSPNPKTITRFGDTKISTTQSKYGGSSILADGSGDYLSTTISGGLGSGNFTIEAWFYLITSPANSTIWFNSRTGGIGSDGIDISVNGNTTTNGQVLIAGNLSVSTGTWYHLAVTRENGVLKRWFNGVQNGSVNFATSLTGTSVLMIGSNVGNIGYVNGYVDSYRVTIGTARYTANFNPETDTYLS